MTQDAILTVSRASRFQYIMCTCSREIYKVSRVTLLPFVLDTVYLTPTIHKHHHARTVSGSDHTESLCCISAAVVCTLTYQDCINILYMKKVLNMHKE